VEALPESERHRADGIFEGGGVKGLGFVGALQAAEEVVGITEWVNVAGTSAGAITAALLAAGYAPRQLGTLLPSDLTQFRDYGPGGPLFGRAWNMLRHRGMVRGEAFKNWFGDRLADPRALGDRDATFAELKRTDIPADTPPEQREVALYRLRVIASDVSAGRMLVLPQDILGFHNEDGDELTPDTLRIVDAVRMSMGFPFFFEPVSLFDAAGDEHLIVDGGLLSNYPIWLFDSDRPVRRHTWGFRLQPGKPGEAPKPRSIRGPLWEYGMARAIMHAAMSAWDDRAERSSRIRTINIPTGNIRTLAFKLKKGEPEMLRTLGHDAATEFFMKTHEYVNSYGRTAPAPHPAPR
jgi:NTE family protein